MLKINPRPAFRDSIVDAELEPDDSDVVDYEFESRQWDVVLPSLDDEALANLIFVDGVQRIDANVVDDRPGQRPLGGVMASYAVGAMYPARDPALDPDEVLVERLLIASPGADHADRRISFENVELTYKGRLSEGVDAVAFNRVLMESRAQLEAHLLSQIADDRGSTVVYDGRLPPIGPTKAIGLIKNPHLLPFTSSDERMGLLGALKIHERTRILRRRRSERMYATWFVCLRTPEPADFSLSGVVMLEMDESSSRDDVIRTADLTQRELPFYASDPIDDPRAPQNLAPVGELERELREYLGDPDIIHDAIRMCLVGEGA